MNENHHLEITFIYNDVVMCMALIPNTTDQVSLPFVANARWYVSLTFVTDATGQVSLPFIPNATGQISLTRNKNYIFLYYGQQET